MPGVRLDGLWLPSLGHVSQVAWSSRWGEGPCGPDLASCTLQLDRANDSSWLRTNATLEVFNDAGRLVFAGPTTDVGRGEVREIAARSWGRLGEDFDAVDSSGNPTTNPATALTQAIANGLPWSSPTGFDDVALGVDGTASLNRVPTLLTSWASKNGKRWAVDVNGYVSAVTDPTVPTLLLDAWDLDIGVADDGMFTRVRARYVSSVDGTTGDPNGWSSVVVNDSAAQAVYGIKEYPMDLTPLGLISSASATSYGEAQIALLTVPRWLSRVTTNRQRLLTLGGQSADVQEVAAGQVVRLFNVPKTLGGIQSELAVDVLLGGVEYDSDSPDDVTLAPVDMAVANLADSLAQAAEAARRTTNELAA